MENMEELTDTVDLFNSCLFSYRTFSSAIATATELVEWDVLLRIELARFEVWGRTLGFLDEKMGMELQDLKCLKVTGFAEILQVEGALSLVHDILKSLLQALDDFKNLARKYRLHPDSGRTEEPTQDLILAIKDDDKASLLAKLRTANDGLGKFLSIPEQKQAARSLPSRVLPKYHTPMQLDALIKSVGVNQDLIQTAKIKQLIFLPEDTPIRDFELSSAQFTGLPDEVDFTADNPYSGSCTAVRYISPGGASHTALIECAESAPLERSRIPEAERRRRNKVVALLKKASRLPRHGDTVCRVPECLGWFTFRAMHDGTEIEILGFASEAPSWVDPTIPPYSLRKIMEQGYWAASGRPPLGTRICLARAVVQAVYHLQCGGWLHRSFGGHQIIFFYDRDSGNLRMDEPFLRGLPHSRLDGQPVGRDQEVHGKLRRDSETVVETNVYKHPDLWSTSPRHYRPSDDIYSLGVVLLEIGMWRRVGPDVTQREDVHLLKVARSTLPAAVGAIYTQVVVGCLEGMQGEDSGTADDGPSNKEGENGVESQFLWKVLRPLENLRV
ncbi:uncharacterized protein APUU_12278A [Aspergillus puulaauensis]|uniref:Prion-inhibition and propagation HeLo domain-containing protein n=1 Tax=Aspergillus puulaauensis TaxID=1220207 RepID=A0A7R8AJB3_9EURO|nr:uncharacterized protein APUU_12278A [Aspergillus puulaauensis]BCS19450.1 hypothetical protein APUU_12278A [Aspergillus puulaauensis]